jgi:hypothetical protein
VIQQGQVFKLKARGVRGRPLWAYRYRLDGRGSARIDYHYGHLAHDSREHAVSLVDALALERAVDAAWTPPGPANPVLARVSGHPRRRSARTVDARWTSTHRRAVPVANERS